jgi:CHAT domain-containing protein
MDGSGEFVAFTDSLGDLPFARFEAAAPSRWASSQAAFSGEQVTRKKIFSVLAGAEWLHIGCHARQMLANDDLTGVYLADVADDEQSRMLSLRSIARDARLRKGAIVVLSGCETGSVTPRMADEYISLAGAFIAAGASAVVASLWKVRDSAALLLMHRFYGEIEILGDLPRALQSAQIWLRELTAHDAYQILVQIVPESPNREALLVDFAARDRHCPFAAVADWGAFQIVGPANRRYPAAQVSKVSS